MDEKKNYFNPQLPEKLLLRFFVIEFMWFIGIIEQRDHSLNYLSYQLTVKTSN